MELRLPFGGSIQSLDYSTRYDAPFTMIIKSPEMKAIRASLDFNKYISIFRPVEQVVTLPLWTNKK